MSSSHPLEISTRPPQAAEAIGTVPCAICRRQFSRYTCPKCNIPYCSLTCFRSELHSGCSETFYRKEIESDVQTTPSNTTEERQKILQLLKHFEEDTMDESSLDTDEDDEEIGAELVERLGNLDIESASYDELWASLTTAERDRFLKMLGDPQSDLAQQLLASEELETAHMIPWWEAPVRVDDEGDIQSSNAQRKKYGRLPEMLQIPRSMVSTQHVAGKTPLLLYNMCAICIAYAYVTRYFSTSPISTLPADDREHEDACGIISRLIPFLTDRKSKTIYPTLSSVVTDLWSRFEQGKMNPPFFSVLLRDAATLLRPSSVTEIPADSYETQDLDSVYSPSKLETHTSVNVLRVLSDLSHLFDNSSNLPIKTGSKAPVRSNHVALKLTFYAAHALGVPPILFRALADEAAARANVVASEGIDVTPPPQATSSSLSVGPANVTRIVANGKARIEELT